MKDLYISRTRLPSLAKYNKYLRKIWKSNWLTNNGELVQTLEKRLEKHLKVKNVVCVSSGTMALMLALKILGWRKVYVSPYNFIATVAAPVWMGLDVKFMDIHEKQTPAIITHLYGFPDLINKKPVIYDASHAFSTKIGSNSIMSYGDCSIISFHAVKTFQTIEGGALVTENDELADKARSMRNYGFVDHYTFDGVGINGKMNEFEAAMGLCSLDMVKSTMKRYQEIITKYNNAFEYIYPDYLTYYPLYYDSEEKLRDAIELFEENKIHVRRYFYPPLNKVFEGKQCYTAEDFSNRVLCIPLYYALTDEDVDRIIKVAKKTL